jgi:hypothetical protein
MTAGASRAATTITPQPALAPPPQPGQLRRGERYRPSPALQGFPFGCQSGGPI